MKDSSILRRCRISSHHSCIIDPMMILDPEFQTIRTIKQSQISLYDLKNFSTLFSQLKRDESSKLHPHALQKLNIPPHLNLN